MHSFGIDWDGPLPEEADCVEMVIVPELPALLNNDQLSILLNSVDPLKQSEVFGIDLHIQAKQIVNNILQ